MKKFITLLFLFLVGIISPSCEKEDDIPKVNTKLKSLWEPDIIENGTLKAVVNSNIVYNNNVLYTGIDGIATSYYMVNGKTGDILWKWDDFMDGDNWGFSADITYQYQEYLVIQQLKHSYCINLATGQTVWKKELANDYRVRVWGIDDYYFLISSREEDSLGQYIDGLYVGNIGDGGNEELVLYPPYDSISGTIVNTSGRLYMLHPFKNTSGEILISFTYGEILPNDEVDNYLGLYNFTKKEWIYNRKQVSFDGKGANFYAYEDKFYLGNDDLRICDIMTGEVLAHRRYSHDSGIGRMLRIGDKLVAQKGEAVYGFDAYTAEELWMTEAASNAGYPQSLNGVFYYVSSGDGHLYAIDADTGHLLWRSRSPDSGPSAGKFTQMLSILPSVDGGEGRIYTSSYMNGYCFEAAR